MASLNNPVARLAGEGAKGIQLIGVRTPAEYARGTVDGAISIPVDHLRSRIEEVQSDVIVHCQVGLRGYLSARTLAQHGRPGAQP